MATECIPVPLEGSASKSGTAPRAVLARRSNRESLPPAVVIGGGANALSIARSLGRGGIPVYAINKPTAAIRYSRYAKMIPIPAANDYPDAWASYLTGPASAGLHGAVLLAASDAGLKLIANHRSKLERNFMLDESNPQAQMRMLDKLTTYQAAADAGVPVPKFWGGIRRADLDRVRESLVYPLLVKPTLSYSFTDRFRGKFFVADHFDDVVRGLDRVEEANIESVLVEKIPGPDDRLCSYYTYLDEDGSPLFDFTKRIIRRNPPNMGLACYHVTDWNPEVRDVALKLFRAVGLRGLANAEFKRDNRDGQLKLIECNARFTEANGLVARCGLDLARFVYNRIVGLPQAPMENYRKGLRLWYPMEDLRSFLALRQKGELTMSTWIMSLMHSQTLPLFRWTDPIPSLAAAWHRTRRSIGSKKLS